MASPLKRILFFLALVLMLRASPAHSVPLASAVDGPGTVAHGSSDYLLAGGGEVNAEGEVEGSEIRAGIVDNEHHHSDFGMSGQAAMTGAGSRTPGWLLPGAAVGAGGGALFALASHGNKHGNGNGGNGGIGGGGAPGGNLGLGGHDGTPGDDYPSDVPEPGTVALMGIGIASILGRRKLARK